MATHYLPDEALQSLQFVIFANGDQVYNPWVQEIVLHADKIKYRLVSCNVVGSQNNFVHSRKSNTIILQVLKNLFIRENLHTLKATGNYVIIK